MTARTARCAAAEGVVSAERGENVWRNIGLAAWSESLEPDEALAIGLPLDDG